jgi:adenylylsulfate kinase-like enzyme
MAQAIVTLFIQTGHKAAMTQSRVYDTLPSGTGPTNTTVEHDIQWATSQKQQGVVPIVAAESPRAAQRGEARSRLEHFIEVYVATPKAACIDRDTMGIWKAALNGDLRNFVGVDRPYETPEMPQVTVDLAVISMDEAVAQCANTLEAMGFLNPPSP